MANPTTVRLQIGPWFLDEPMPQEMVHKLSSAPEMARAVTHLSLKVDSSDVDSLLTVSDLIRCCFNVEHLELDITPMALNRLAEAGLQLKRVHTLRLSCLRFQSRKLLCAFLAMMPSMRVLILAMAAGDYCRDEFAASEMRQKLLEYRGQCDTPFLQALLSAGSTVHLLRTLELRVDESTGSIPDLSSLVHLTRLKIKPYNGRILRLSRYFPAALATCRHLRHLEIDYYLDVHPENGLVDESIAAWYGALRAVARQLLTLVINCAHGPTEDLSLATHLPPLLVDHLSSLRALAVKTRIYYSHDRMNFQLALAATCSVRRVRLDIEYIGL